jgi:ribonuclease R
MSKRFSERILEFLRRPDYRPMKTPRLAKAMGIAEAEQGSFGETVDALRRVGRVVLGTNNAVMLPHPPNQVVGTFRGNPRGFGFVVPDGSTSHGDLYVAPNHTLDAVTGDRVLCQVLSRGKRDGKDAFGGRIIKIVERGDGRFVGQLRREGGLWFVQPDGNTLHVPIMVDDVGAKRAKAGDQVVVEIVRYPSEGRPARGVIVERLGKQGAPGVDLATVMRQFHLPDAFGEEVLEEARRVTRAFDADAALRKREDLTDRVIVTIDPDDAKDFDDAITLEKLSGAGGRSAGGRRGGGRALWELGVHIADVSTFVREGGALDAEARGRGTSVYFSGHVIPMLPEILSNGVCSLQEGEPRLTKSAFIQYDAGGVVVGTRFANTVIRSTCRLTYNQATQILDGRAGRLPKQVVSLVKEMDRLARVIQKRRLSEGMVVLDLPEVDLVLDDNGRVIDAVPEDTSFSHTIIEMFMVEANEAVARLMANRGIPCLRRIHPEPDEASLTAMARFMRAAGFAVPSKVTAADLQSLLAPLRGKPEAYAVNLAVLKSMSLAEYSPKLVGHFALASRHYAHFTSPIRRYPDLMLHRLLDRVVAGPIGGKQKRGLEDVPSEVELEESGRKLSYASRRAEAAERELRTIKLLQLLSEHVGEEFKGVVTGVTNFGLFVQHPRYLIDGLLRVEDLGDDWWDVDVKVGRVTGERTRQSFTMGTILPVRIAEVDVSARQLNLVLSSSGRGPAQRRRPAGSDGRLAQRGGKGTTRRDNARRGRRTDRSRHR